MTAELRDSARTMAGAALVAMAAWLPSGLAQGTDSLHTTGSPDSVLLHACMAEGPPVSASWALDGLLKLELGDDPALPARQEAEHLLTRGLCGDPDRHALRRQWQAMAPSLRAAALAAQLGEGDAAEVAAVIPQVLASAGQRDAALRALLIWQRDQAIAAPLPRLREALAWALNAEAGEQAGAGAAVTAVTAAEAVSLHQRAMRLLSANGDTAAQRELGDTLMACAHGHGANPFCLHGAEGGTGLPAAVQPLWRQADARQRRWLAHWAAPVPENRAFFAGELPDAGPAVQAALLEGPLAGTETDADVDSDTDAGADAGAALARDVIRQALADPQRRPAAVPLPLEQDPWHSPFGATAYAGQPFPSALSAAFRALAGVDDEPTRALYRELDALDHPWLVTMAGIARLGHDHQADAVHLLRHVRDEDGLPAAHVLTLADTGIGLASHSGLMVAIARDGFPDKWQLLAQLQPPLALTGAVREAVQARVHELPGRMRKLVPLFDLNDSPELLLLEMPDAWAELETSVLFAQALAEDDPAALAAFGDALLADRQPYWHVLAMSLLAGQGDARVPALVEQFSGHPVALAREAAAQAGQEYEQATAGVAR